MMGCDEAWSLGLGQYLKKNGYTDPKVIIRKHLARCVDIAHKYGFKPRLSGDMFFSLAGAQYTDNPDIITPEIAESIRQDFSSFEKTLYSFDYDSSKYGYTPKQYILQRKMQVACSLLEENLYSISEIADLLDFSSSQHFSSSFKKKLGISPDEYRRSKLK